MKYLILSISSIALSVLLLQGCAVAAIGAGVGAVKYGNAKKAEANASCKNAYNGYLERMQKIDPENIIPLDEYCG